MCFKNPDKVCNSCQKVSSTLYIVSQGVFIKEGRLAKAGASMPSLAPLPGSGTRVDNSGDPETAVKQDVSPRTCLVNNPKQFYTALYWVPAGLFAKRELIFIVDGEPIFLISR